MNGVGRYVATFVITVNSEVESHELDEFGIVITQHCGEVVAPVLGGVDGTDARAVLVGVAVDGGCYDGQLGDEVNGVFIYVLEGT